MRTIIIATGGIDIIRIYKTLIIRGYEYVTLISSMVTYITNTMMGSFQTFVPLGKFRSRMVKTIPLRVADFIALEEGTIQIHDNSLSLKTMGNMDKSGRYSGFWYRNGDGC